MDIWEKLYQRAEKEYHPEDVSPFVYCGMRFGKRGRNDLYGVLH